MWLSINEDDAQPLYLQIVEQIRAQVAGGGLKEGDELPSVRELADSLGINMHTVRSAYLKLRDQGVISMRLGRRARVTAAARRIETAQSGPDWRKSLREALTDATLAGASPEEIRRAAERQLEELAREKNNPGGKIS